MRLPVDDCLEHRFEIDNDRVDRGKDKATHNDEMCFFSSDEILYDIRLYKGTAALENLE
jgi:hypothetical protein